MIDWEKRGRCHETTINGTTIKVHMYIGCGYSWFLSCPELKIDIYDLKTTDLDIALKNSLKYCARIMEDKIYRYEETLKLLKEVV